MANLNFTYKRVNHFAEIIKNYKDTCDLQEHEWIDIENKLQSEEIKLITKKYRYADYINHHIISTALEDRYNKHDITNYVNTCVEILKKRREHRNEINNLRVIATLCLKDFLSKNFPTQCNAKDISTLIAKKIPYNLHNLKCEYSISRQDEELLKNNFETVHETHTKIMKQGHNFFNYRYLLHKECELFLGKDIVGHPYTTSSVKLSMIDQDWRKICDHLGWEFIPTNPSIRK